VVGLAFAAFVGGIGVMGLLESEFFPQFDQGEFQAMFKTAPSASIDETSDRMEAVLGVLGGLPEVERTYATIGAGDAGTVRDGRVYVKLTDRSERDRTQRDVERHVRAQLYAIPGIVPSLAQAESMDNRKPLLVNVRGEDIGLLKEYSQRLKDALYQVPGIVDLEATLEHDTPEYRLLVDRERAADAGLNTAMISGAVGALVGGQAVTTFEDEDGEARSVRVRLPASLRRDAAQIEGLRLAARSTGGRTPVLVPVGSIAHYELSTTPSEINRMDLSREVVVGANMDGLPLGTAVARVLEEGEKLGLPPGYKVMISGENEAMEESFGYMTEALILAVLFVYLILAAQFESFIDPLAIMLSLPLSVVGMAGMLFITGDTINMMSFIGLIMLMGLVTKNAILLVDFAKVLRGRGLDRRQAVIEAGRTRLRPIVMTTLAMIFGMLPLALALGAGAEMRAPMARAVIGGLITSTLLTLVVVPVVYTLLDDLSAWLFRGRKHAPAPAAAGLLVAVASVVLFGAQPASAQSEAGLLPAMTRAVEAVPAGSAPSAQPKDVRVLTLEDALAIAAAQNRDVQKAVEYQKWVQGKYVEERAAAMPQASFSGNVLRQFDNSQSKLFREFTGFGAGDAPAGDGPDFGDIFGGRQDVRMAELRVSQPIYTWGQVGAAIRAARIGFELADAQIRRFRQAVTKDVSTAFYDVLVARELAGIAAQDLAQKQRHLDEARRRHSAGTATDYEVLAAEVAADNAKPSVIRAGNLVRLTKERLRFLLAETGGEIDVAGTLEAPIDPAPSYDEVLAQALRNRPEFAELASQRGIYTELVTITRAANKPRLDFAASLGERSLGLKTLSSYGTTWNAAVVATVPLFDGMRTKGRIAQVQSEIAQLTIDEAKLRDGLALEARTAVDAVQEAAEIVTALRGTVKQAEKLLFMVEKGFEFGVKTHLEVQDAQLNLQAARANLARAQRDYKVSRVTLDWVTGATGSAIQ
jgi:hydrophobic/amphiphilic exporter-1 (mainly G- bacteria), HAE1 family